MLAPPFSKCFLGILREAEIDCAGEELLAPINAAGRKQFLGANQTHQLGLLGADQVLPAFSARSGEVGRAHMAAARKVGNNGGVFVVGMGALQRNRDVVEQPVIPIPERGVGVVHDQGEALGPLGLAAPR